MFEDLRDYLLFDCNIEDAKVMELIKKMRDVVENEKKPGGLLYKSAP